MTYFKSMILISRIINQKCHRPTFNMAKLKAILNNVQKNKLTKHKLSKFAEYTHKNMSDFSLK